MNQGLKERLIGAAVLVALGVWLIPWVLDGPEEQSENRSAALELPVPEAPVPMRSQTIRLDERRDPPGSAVASSTSTEASTDEPRVADSTEPQAAAIAAAREPPSAAPEPLQVPPKPPVDTAPPPEQAAVAAPASAARAAVGGWVVQLGSFSEEENARRLAQRVATFGYSPSITNHRASGRTMYRVRVGPHESRARADAAASALSAHGFVAQVVNAD
jgi:DedD protein